MKATNNALSNAIKEKNLRQEAQDQELKKLISVTSSAINKSNINKEIILKEISQDISTINNISPVLQKSDNPYPLVYNKLAYLLKGAKIIVQDHFPEIVSGKISLLEHKTQDTSIPNYLQTALLETLSIIRKTPVNQIADLEKEKIYDINSSPNIQGVKDSNNKSFASVKNWRWCSKDKGYDELITPALGYFFGGSRYDSNYHNKYFKQEDCSTSLGKWLNLTNKTIESFTTTSILTATNNNIVKSILKPIGEDRAPKKGDIFVFKGHCGLVADYQDSVSPVNSISYTRNMPFFEGLIYQKYAQVENGKKVITADWKNIAENKILEPYYGLDNKLGEISAPKISGEIFYFEEI